MKITFRCDYGPQVGFGHLTRCLTLAKILDDWGHKVSFASQKNESSGAIPELQGEHCYYFPAIDLDVTEPELSRQATEHFQPDVLLIDSHYPYSTKQITDLERYCRVVLLDNLCPGGIAASRTIIPVAHANGPLLKPLEEAGKLYHGGQYAIIAPHITELPEFTGIPHGVVITTGGGDPMGMMERLLNGLIGHDYLGEVTALIGVAFTQEYIDRLYQLELPDTFELVPFDPRHLQRAMVAICHFCVTVYELLYLGVPVICSGHDEKHARDAAVLTDKYGCVVNLGILGAIDPAILVHELNNIAFKRDELVRRGKEVVSQNGAENTARLIVAV